MSSADRARLAARFSQVHFYNADLTEVQDDVRIGAGSRVGSFTLIHAGARIGARCTVGSHCNICRCEIGDGVAIQTGCHITHGVVIEDGVFIGPGVITLNDKHMDGSELVAPVIRAGARIGGGTLLLPGIIVGRNAVIGAGSVVTRSVPENEVVTGIPARPRHGRPARPDRES